MPRAVAAAARGVRSRARLGIPAPLVVGMVINHLDRTAFGIVAAAQRTDAGIDADYDRMRGRTLTGAGVAKASA